MATLYETICRVGNKNFAAYLALNNLGNTLPLLLASGAWINREGAPVILVVGRAVIPIIMGILLWVYAPKIADKKISSSVKDDAISEGG